MGFSRPGSSSPSRTPRSPGVSVAWIGQYGILEGSSTGPRLVGTSSYAVLNDVLARLPGRPGPLLARTPGRTGNAWSAVNLAHICRRSAPGSSSSIGASQVAASTASLRSIRWRLPRYCKSAAPSPWVKRESPRTTSSMPRWCRRTCGSVTMSQHAAASSEKSPAPPSSPYSGRLPQIRRPLSCDWPPQRGAAICKCT